MAAALVENLRVSDLEDVDLDSPSRFPRYYSYSSRVESYPDRWIKKQSPQSMSCAGFYFTDVGDIVQCFHCGIRLGNWNTYDDPLIEHARWSPECEYVIALKGEEFPKNVQAGIDYYDDLEADGAQNTEVLSERERENPLLTPAAQSVLEMGYRPEDVTTAIQHVLQEQGWEHLKAENIMSVVLDMEDKGILKSTQSFESAAVLSGDQDLDKHFENS